MQRLRSIDGRGRSARWRSVRHERKARPANVPKPQQQRGGPWLDAGHTTHSGIVAFGTAAQTVYCADQMPVVKARACNGRAEAGITPVDQTAMRAPSPMPATAGLSSSATGGIDDACRWRHGNRHGRTKDITIRIRQPDNARRSCSVAAEHWRSCESAWAPQGGISPLTWILAIRDWRVSGGTATTLTARQRAG